MVAKEDAYQKEIHHLTASTSHRISQLQDVTHAKENQISTMKLKMECMEKTSDDNKLAADEKIKNLKRDLGEKFKREMDSLKEQTSIQEAKLRNQYINLENTYKKLKGAHDETKIKFCARESELQEQFITDLSALNKNWSDKLTDIENVYSKKFEESNANHCQAMNKDRKTFYWKVVNLKHQKEIEMSLLRSELTYLVDREQKEHHHSVCMLSDKINSIALSRKNIAQELVKIKKEKESGDEELIKTTKHYETVKKDLYSIIVEYKKVEKTLQSENIKIKENLNICEIKNCEYENKVSSKNDVRQLLLILPQT